MVFGGLGLIRMPDVFNRIQAGTKTTTLGTLLSLAGAACLQPQWSVKLLLIGLFFQAILFQHGGLSTLGVNATMLGVPALLAYFIFRLRNGLWRGRARDTSGYRNLTAVFAFLGGATGVGLAATIALVLLITTIPAHLSAESERTAIYALILAHVPLMILEGIFTALVVLFLHRVKPDLLESG